MPISNLDRPKNQSVDDLNSCFSSEIINQEVKAENKIISYNKDISM